jgi:hypothetical protein
MVPLSTRPSASLPSLRTAARWAVLIAPIRSPSTREEASLTHKPGRGCFAEAAALGVLQVHLSGGEQRRRHSNLLRLDWSTHGRQGSTVRARLR